jgi:tetratricopeptide (TPR) repeat protein
MALHAAGGLGLFHPEGVYSDHPLYRFYTFLASLPTYLGFLLMPEHLHMAREFPVYLNFFIPRVVEGAGLCLLIVAAVFYKPKQPAAPLAWGALWFVAAFLPYSGILMPINATICEHWIYMPTLGLAIGLAANIDYSLDPHPLCRRIVVGLVAISVLLLGSMTLIQNTVWRDPVSFYENIFLAGEKSPEGHNDFGKYYYDRGDIDKAIEQFQIAISNSTSYAMPRYNMGISLLRRDTSPATIAEARRYLEESIDMDPTYLPAYTVLADICAATGDREKESYYRKLATPIPP